MHAVKVEGGGRVIEITRRLTEIGMPVMGHLGLTPQFVHQMGGFKVQGKSEAQAARILLSIVASSLGVTSPPSAHGPARQGPETRRAARSPS